MRRQIGGLTKRIVVGLVVILAMLAIIPMPVGAIGPLDVITSILGTINDDLGESAVQIRQISNQVMNFRQQVLYPPNLLNQARNSISRTIGSYRSWMQQVYSQPLESAATATAVAIDRSMRSQRATTPATLRSPYEQMYGAPMNPSVSPSPSWALQANAVDLSDAVALNALSLSTATDQAGTSLISQAQSLESQSGTTAPGTADMLVAQANALQLQSLAAQHKLLAAELRQEAAQVAVRSVEMKHVMESNQQARLAFQKAFDRTGGKK